MGDLKSVDVLALNPEDLLDAEVDGADGIDGADRDADIPDAISDFKVNRPGTVGGALFLRGGELAVPSVNFPDRPLVSDPPPPLVSAAVWSIASPLFCALQCLRMSSSSYEPSPCFPAPQSKVDSYALNTLKTTDTDFDGDEIYLEDIWQQTIHVPKVRAA
jgi:hypothetical protein